MKELFIATSPDPGRAELFPDPAVRIAGWETKAATWEAFGAMHYLPDVTMVTVKIGALAGMATSFVRKLAEKQTQTRGVSVILWHIEASERPDSNVLTSLLRSFDHPERVEFRWTKDALDPAVIQEYLAEIAPKLEVLQEIESVHSGAPARPSPLDRLGSITAATRRLRTGNGRLSAEAVADLYEIPISRLATWLGRNRQTVIKTPDAESLQPALEYFERAARLLAILPTDDFRKWMRTPNVLIDGRRPLDLMSEGKWQIVADFIDDMLTGNPT